MAIFNTVYGGTWWWGGWWQPWANTIAYWKLDGDTTDSWPNHATLIGTPNFATSGSLTYWVFSDDIVYWALSTSTPISISSWLNLTNYDNSYMWYFAIWDTAYNRYYLWLNNGKKIMLLQNEQNKTSTTSCPENQWFNLVFTTDWTTTYAYLDWTLIYTVAAWHSVSWTNVYVWCRQEPSKFKAEWWKGYISNLIIENKVWTADEISAYYNQTKWNYWL